MRTTEHGLGGPQPPCRGMLFGKRHKRPDVRQKRRDHCAQVTIPFLLLHGGADAVTDPEVSAALHDQAKSFDKTFKLYPGMWHGLLTGEPDDNCELVWHDILAWLDQRSGAAGPAQADPAASTGATIKTGEAEERAIQEPADVKAAVATL